MFSLVLNLIIQLWPYLTTLIFSQTQLYTFIFYQFYGNVVLCLYKNYFVFFTVKSISVGFHNSKGIVYHLSILLTITVIFYFKWGPCHPLFSVLTSGPSLCHHSLIGYDYLGNAAPSSPLPTPPPPGPGSPSHSPGPWGQAPQPGGPLWLSREGGWGCGGTTFTLAADAMVESEHAVTSTLGVNREANVASATWLRGTGSTLWYFYKGLGGDADRWFTHTDL